MAPLADLQPISPTEAGFAPELEARLDRLIADKRVWNLHGVVVARNGRLVLERYFEGEDITAGNYGADQWIPPTRVLNEVVMASLA